MYLVAEVNRTRTAMLLGYKATVILTAIGVVLHELGHALFAVIFGHRITQIVFFRPNYETGDLGHVEHTYSPANFYHCVGNLFIGIGPVLLGAVVIFSSAALLVGKNVFMPLYATEVTMTTLSSLDHILAWLETVGTGVLDVFKLLFDASNLVRWEFYAFLYLVFSIGLHLQLSPSDLQGAWKGLVVVTVLLVCFNLATLWLGDVGTSAIVLVSSLYSFFYGYMVFALILNAAIALILMMLTTALGFFGRLRYAG